MNKKEILIVTICTLISTISGILTKDFLGAVALVTALLCSYYASVGKRINYLLGLINYLIIGYVSFKNHLYGLFGFSMIVFTPLQIIGFLSWNKNLDKDNNVKAREFTLKNSIIITLSCVVGSFIVGYFLSIIPGQQLAYFDAASNCINFCAVILMILRFKEAWFVWLFNNVIDLIIWSTVTVNHGSNSIMMLLVAVGYLLINFYGIVQWSILAKKNKRKKISKKKR